MNLKTIVAVAALFVAAAAVTPRTAQAQSCQDCFAVLDQGGNPIGSACLNADEAYVNCNIQCSNGWCDCWTDTPCVSEAFLAVTPEGDLIAAVTKRSVRPRFALAVSDGCTRAVPDSRRSPATSASERRGDVGPNPVDDDSDGLLVGKGPKSR